MSRDASIDASKLIDPLQGRLGALLHKLARTGSVAVL